MFCDTGQTALISPSYFAVCVCYLLKLGLCCDFQLKCRLSGHEMPYSLQALQTYVNGKKFQKLCQQSSFNDTQFKQFFLPAKKKTKR